MLAASVAGGGREYVSPEGARPRLVNVNTADADELQLLPGIGEVKAGYIIEYRQEHGPFCDVESLLEVPGIGRAVLDGFRDYVCFDTVEDGS